MPCARNALITGPKMSLPNGVFTMLYGGRFGGPHGEARVVLRGEHDIADSREFGENGPVLGIELAGVERLREVGEESAGVVVGGAGEGVADDRAELAVDGPVNEEAEALVAEPFETVGLVLSGEGRGGEEEREGTHRSSVVRFGLTPRAGG